MKTDQLTLGSLFDGIGGFPYAASFYGIRPLWASEIVPECVSVTKKHFPEMEHVGDITKLDGGKLPPVDIIAWCVYDAQYFGTAQRRRRIFLVADFRGTRAGEILFVPKSLSGYFAAGGTPRQGPAAYAQSGAGTAGAGIDGYNAQLTGHVAATLGTNCGMSTGRNGVIEMPDGVGAAVPAISMRIRCGCEGGGKGPLLQIEKSGTLATGNDQYLFAPKDAVEILNDQGGDSLSVEKGGVSPTLRSQTHGNLPITAYAIQGSMIGRTDGNGPQGDGINENVSFTLNTIDRHAVCMATGQSNAEIMEEKSPTLVAGHEQPIVTHPQIAGTLCASGAGLSRPAGQGNELDFCVVSAGFKHKAGSQSGSIGFQEETAPTLLAGQQSAVMKAYVIGAYHSGGMLSDNPKSGFYEADTSRTLDLNGGNPCCNQGGVAVVEGADGAETAAVDCRNLRETDEVSGTLLAKAASGGYSLNYQNPVRTGLCVRRLTPTEAERLQGYPDGWTEAGADGRAISDTKRYQMLGNSVAVPCVAYIMQGIRDAVGGE